MLGQNKNESGTPTLWNNMIKLRQQFFFSAKIVADGIDKKAKLLL